MRRILQPQLLLLVSLLALLLGISVGISRPDGTYDTSQDWSSQIIAQGVNGCKFVPPPSNAAAPQCSPSSRRLAKADIAAVVWKLAPKVYMHPEEWYLLTDPKKWIENSPIFNTTGESTSLQNITRDLAEPAYYEYELTGKQNAVSELINVSKQSYTTAEMNSITSGDPVVDGKSQAKVWFTISEPYRTNITYQHMYQITFGYFYEFNGCSNQMFAMAMDGKYQGNEYFMCSPGVHEGDWERISMLVCQSDMEALIDNTEVEIDSSTYISRIQYNAHSWSNTYDCTVGECPTETGADGITRPIAFSGLFSHASYPMESPLIVYQQIKFDMLLNIEGFYLADRTSKEGAVFEPTEANIGYIPMTDEMSDDQKFGEFAWALYPGSWGGFYMKSDKSSITCFDNNFTTMKPCNPENPATYFMTWGLGAVGGDVVDDVWSLEWYADLDFEDNGPVGVQDLTSLLFRQNTYMWMMDKPSPLWEEGRTLRTLFQCPFTGDPSDTSTDSYSLQHYDIFGFLGAVAGLLIGCGLLFGILLYIWVLYQPKDAILVNRNDKSDGGAAGWTVETAQSYMAMRHFLWMVTSFCAYIVGVVLCCIGIADAISALESLVKSSLWSAIEEAFIAVITLFGVCQALFIFFTIFFRSQEILWFGGKRCKNPVAWKGASKFGAVIQAISSALSVIMINTTMLLCSFGFFLWVARYIFSQACDQVISTMRNITNGIFSQICLNLSNIGIDKSFCGADLTQICSKWSGLRIEYIVYGSFIFVLAHIMFVSMGSFQCQALYLDHCMRAKEMSSRAGDSKYQASNSSLSSISKQEKVLDKQAAEIEVAAV